MLTLELDSRVIDAFVSTGVLSHPVGIYNDISEDALAKSPFAKYFNPCISYRAYVPSIPGTPGISMFGRCYVASTSTEYYVSIQRYRGNHDDHGTPGTDDNDVFKWELTAYITQMHKLPANTKFAYVRMSKADVERMLH
jgi:hypothetical protein